MSRKSIDFLASSLEAHRQRGFCSMRYVHRHVLRALEGVAHGLFPSEAQCELLVAETRSNYGSWANLQSWMNVCLVRLQYVGISAMDSASLPCGWTVLAVA